MTPEPGNQANDGYHTIDPDEAKELQASVRSEDDLDSLAQQFNVLSEVSRLKIMSYLSNRELCVHDLTALMDMKQSAVSHQLARLRELGLVDKRKDGRVVYYSLSDDLSSSPLWSSLIDSNLFDADESL